MKGNLISRPEYASKSSALQALRLTKIFLLIFLLGVCIVGKRKTTWPIVSWALYSGYTARFRPPEPSVTMTELRVTTTTGNSLIVKPEDILTLPRDSLSHNIVEHAFDDTDISVRNESRRYLVRAVSNFLGKNSKIRTIQAWQLSYSVEPLAVPPIQMQTPATETMLGSFSAENLTESN